MIKERIIQLIKYKGLRIEDFFSKIGYTSANFRGNAKKTPLNSDAIENIFTEIPDINLEWLITGKGEMLKGDMVMSDSEKVAFQSEIIKLMAENKRLTKELQKK